MSIFTVWRAWISERRLAVDNGFYSAIQEMLQVEDVILPEYREVCYTTQFREFLSINTVAWRLWIRERRLSSNYLLI